MLIIEEKLTCAGRGVATIREKQGSDSEG